MVCDDFSVPLGNEHSCGHRSHSDSYRNKLLNVDIDINFHIDFDFDLYIYKPYADSWKLQSQVWTVWWIWVHRSDLLRLRVDV